MNIDSKVLEESINEIKDEKFKQQMREWIVFGSPPEVAEIFKRYCDKMEEVETRTANQVVLTLLFMAICVVIFVVYHSFNLISVASCFK
jgi:uncharacterized membrane protein